MAQDEDNVSTIPENDMTDHATSDDAGSLVTAHENEGYFDAEPKLMSEKEIAAADANLAPRRHNLLFALLFFCLFVAALVDQRGRIQQDEHKPCEFGSSQKRDMAQADQDSTMTTSTGLPRQDLLNNCQNLEIWPESLQPSTLSTFASYFTHGKREPSDIPAISTATMLPVAEPASNMTCSTEGELMCHGPDYFGICTHGTIMWRHVANGTQCREGKIAGTNMPVSLPSSYGNGLGSATAWGTPDIPAIWTATMPSSDSTTFQTMVYPMGSASSYGNDTEYSVPVVEKLTGYHGRCHAQGDRHVGDPDMCYCYPDVTDAGKENIPHAINHACKFFENISLGPAKVPGQDWKQVFASNFMYKDGDKMSRILIKMQYWADVNGNDIRQGAPCLIFRVSWGQCTKAFSSLLNQCSQYAMNGRTHYASGYGMDSCAMWTIDLNPSRNNKEILETIDGNYDFWLLEDPARNTKSKVSSGSVTWPEPTTPTWPLSVPGSTSATLTTLTTICGTRADVQECLTHTLS